MKYTVGPRKSYHTMNLQKGFEGTAVSIDVFIHSSMEVYVQTDQGQEQVFFAIENGQDYLTTTENMYIDDIFITKIPLTRMEKAEMKHYAFDLYEEIENDKEERFNKEELLSFAYNAFNDKMEGYEEYPRSIRERIELLNREEIHPFIQSEFWEKNKILHVAYMDYETLEKMTETRLQEMKKSYELRKIQKRKERK
ncbi:TPA: hypothetical protein QCU60_004321 [Bacillus cereus]|nr:hypothetical protein [Bacillus cereus]HDR6312335.1 hypothetical protein [Bacillus cereus]